MPFVRPTVSTSGDAHVPARRTPPFSADLCDFAPTSEAATSALTRVAIDQGRDAVTLHQALQSATRDVRPYRIADVERRLRQMVANRAGSKGV